MNKNLLPIITFGTILVFIGIGILSYNFVEEKKQMVFNEMNLELANSRILPVENSSNEDKNKKNLEEDEDNANSDNTSNNSNHTNEYEYYLGKIEIPKINLSRGFYDKNSALNNVRKNIKVLKESDYPDVSGGNLILAGHSGNYSNSYFANLYKLEKGDIAYIYYNNTKYTYEITNIYVEDKDGSVSIKRRKDITTLTLITCTKDDDMHQTIYILELV